MGQIWSKSGQVEFDNNGEPADGCLAYFFVGGTTTPLAVYSNAAESTPHAHGLEADANGRWPFVSIPFTASYDVKVVTEGGTQLYYYTSIPNADPVEASVDSVADEELIQTGDWKFTTKTGAHIGFVRANGRTIGSASSGATERANADCSNLYSFLWDNHDNSILAVATGRGASAAADFAANKAIALFDARSASPFGVDDMGASAASLGSSATYTTGNATTGGSVGGANSHVLTEAQLGAHTHAISITSAADGAHGHSASADTHAGHVHTATAGLESSQHQHTYSGTTGNQNATHIHGMTTVYSFASVDSGASFQALSNNAGSASLGNTSTDIGNHQHTYSGTTGNTNANHNHAITVNSGGSHTHVITVVAASTHTHAVSGTSASTGSGTAHNNVSKVVLGNWLVKL